MIVLSSGSAPAFCAMAGMATRPSESDRPAALARSSPAAWRQWFFMEIPSSHDRSSVRGESFYLDRKSVVSGKSGSERLDLGGRRIIKKNKLHILITQCYTLN